ncbi:F0F1 ATP synthase subunit delta [bacterium]|nr:MAG: F0F1 ATP synthase subunit delta [bacterium]QQR62093.1 MAG: F0F1 ATP synthase subunit delta [bacterium]QQR63350.1 MAG: F0F1 ATP synthase subunit delta [bacterium]
MQLTSSLFQLINLYAQAYIATSDRSLLNEALCIKFEKATKNISKNHMLLSLFGVFFENHESIKAKAVELIVQTYDLPKNINSLGKLLIQKNRLELLPHILKKIITMIHVSENSMHMNITTSHSCNKENVELLIKSFEKKTGKTIVCHWSIDSDLIAGIRAQSATHLWESSIRKKLNSFTTTLKK